MSITDDKRPELEPRTDADQRPAWHRIFRRPTLLGAVCGAVVVVVGLTVWGVHHYRASEPKFSRTAPITLPSKLAGLAAGPLAADFASQPLWRTRAQAAAPGATVVGRSYGSAQLRRQIRVVAGRADLTDKLEFAWAADSGQKVASPLGAARCTQNLIVVPRSAPAVRPTMMFCWRTSSTLSAYGVVINFDRHPTTADGMTALDAAWRAALTGR
jgi:hypothetical protein